MQEKRIRDLSMAARRSKAARHKAEKAERDRVTTLRQDFERVPQAVHAVITEMLAELDTDERARLLGLVKHVPDDGDIVDLLDHYSGITIGLVRWWLAYQQGERIVSSDARDVFE